ncbi:MAG: hypothetical protein QNM02_03150 [Acidimicrobiia bacterium]|nr:hypothetical protein [Acidimicrobiia bacterium]
MIPNVARTLWHHLETVNAVAYFTAECRQAPVDLGLKGFWMGYVASRAAPMGPVSAGVIEATFFNFHPDRIRRAVPDAWVLASPDDIIQARTAAAATALRRLLGDASATQLAQQVIPILSDAIERADGAGRPLFAANRDLPSRGRSVEALWQAATTMREHRGDGHVALLTGAGLDGCEVLVLACGDRTVGPELFEGRGWSPEEWQAAIERLASRGLVTGGGEFTAAGRELRDDIERRTDELAARPFEMVEEEVIEGLTIVLEPAARRIAASGEINYPNPMGLPSVLDEVP